MHQLMTCVEITYEITQANHLGFNGWSVILLPPNDLSEFPSFTIDPPVTGGRKLTLKDKS